MSTFCVFKSLSCVSPASPAPLSTLVKHHIDDDGNGENQDVIGTGDDVHTIGIGHRKLLLRDLRHFAATLVDLIFMINNRALGLHVLAARNMDFEALAQW